MSPFWIGATETKYEATCAGFAHSLPGRGGHLSQPLIRHRPAAIRCEGGPAPRNLAESGHNHFDLASPDAGLIKDATAVIDDGEKLDLLARRDRTLEEGVDPDHLMQRDVEPYPPLEARGQGGRQGRLDSDSSSGFINNSKPAAIHREKTSKLTVMSELTSNSKEIAVLRNSIIGPGTGGEDHERTRRSDLSPPTPREGRQQNRCPALRRPCMASFRRRCGRSPRR